MIVNKELLKLEAESKAKKQSNAESFDAVLAEMQNCHFNGASRQTIERWADRLAAAHAAKVAELRKQLAITIDHYNGTPCAEVRWALEREAMIEYADRAAALLQRWASTQHYTDLTLMDETDAFLAHQGNGEEYVGD